MLDTKVILPILFGISIIGVTQFTFAEEIEEAIEKVSFITVDEEEFKQPKTKYDYQELTIIGYVENYTRGDKVNISKISPDNSEEEITTFASKKGDIYTLLHFTSDAQIGIYELILKYLQ